MMYVYLLRIFSGLWSIRTTKFAFFYIYLWQLKEYHFGRFIDHFRTRKGRHLVINFPVFLKILFFLAFLFPLSIQIKLWIFYGLCGLYFLESFAFIISVLNDKFKKPVFTAKALILLFFAIAVEVLFYLAAGRIVKSVFSLVLCLLAFDILCPLVFSLVVLLFQPVSVILRNRVVKKAERKMKSIKDITAIGITGSYGKTSTKEFLFQILSDKFKVLKTKEHQNSEIAIAKCILNDLNPDYHQIFIVEMAAYNKGKIKQVCSMVKPKIGIITGVNEQHLSLFGSMDNLISAEGGLELAKNLGSDGLIVMNLDNDLIKSRIKNGIDIDKKFYSAKESADIWAENIKVEKDSVSFSAKTKQGETADFKANVYGKHNIQNILGAILVAKELGMSLAKISEAVKKIKPEQSGISLKKSKSGFDIIDSSYSSNPDGVIADLDYLNIWKGKKAIVMPCLIELGSASSQVHEKIGKKIAEVCDLAIITTKDKFYDIKKGAKDANILLVENSKEVSEKLLNFKAGDAVLMEGRSGVKL